MASAAMQAATLLIGYTVYAESISLAPYKHANTEVDRQQKTGPAGCLLASPPTAEAAAS